MALEFSNRDGPSVNLIRTIRELKDARVRAHLCESEVIGDPAAAVDLDRSIDHSSAICGTATLMPAISTAAARLPYLSIFHAV